MKRKLLLFGSIGLLLTIFFTPTAKVSAYENYDFIPSEIDNVEEFDRNYGTWSEYIDEYKVLHTPATKIDPRIPKEFYIEKDGKFYIPDYNSKMDDLNKPLDRFTTDNLYKDKSGYNRVYFKSGVEKFWTGNTCHGVAEFVFPIKKTTDGPYGKITGYIITGFTYNKYTGLITDAEPIEGVIGLPSYEKSSLSLSPYHYKMPQGDNIAIETLMRLVLPPAIHLKNTFPYEEFLSYLDQLEKDFPPTYNPNIKEHDTGLTAEYRSEWEFLYRKFNDMMTPEDIEHEKWLSEAEERAFKELLERMKINSAIRDKIDQEIENGKYENELSELEEQYREEAKFLESSSQTWYIFDKEKFIELRKSGKSYTEASSLATTLDKENAPAFIEETQKEFLPKIKDLLEGINDANFIESIKNVMENLGNLINELFS